MTVTVRIPGVLHAEACGQSALRFPAPAGVTLRTVLDGLATSLPLFDRRIRDERGELRRYVNVYINGEECRRLDGLGTRLADPAEILVVPSVAGG